MPFYKGRLEFVNVTVPRFNTNSRIADWVSRDLGFTLRAHGVLT